MSTLRVLTEDGWLQGVGLDYLLVDRDALVPGTYVPGPATAGVRPSTVLTDIEKEPQYPNYIDLEAPGLGADPEILANGVPIGSLSAGIHGYRFWGSVRFRSPGIVARECVFAGPDPALVPGGINASSCIQCYGNFPDHFEVIDCTISPLPWVAERGRTPNARIMGFQGGNFTARRCEIIGTDAISYQGPNGSAQTAHDAYALIEANWMHFGIYQNDFYPPGADDGQSHNDAFQTTFGKNITLNGNLMGGHRDVSGYLVWPNGYNAGDDFWNAGIMLQQATGMNDTYLIENVTITNNWIAGGTASINHPFHASMPNRFPDTVISDNKILLREDDWGHKKRGDGPGQPGYRADTDRVGGYYLLRSTQHEATYENNTIATLSPDGTWTDTGTPVPISNG